MRSSKCQEQPQPVAHWGPYCVSLGNSIPLWRFRTLTLQNKVVGMVSNTSPGESLRVMISGAIPASNPWSQDPCNLHIKDIVSYKGLWFGAYNAFEMVVFFPCKIFPPSWHSRWAFHFQTLWGQFLLNDEVCDIISESHGHGPQAIPTIPSSLRYFLVICYNVWDSVFAYQAFLQPLNSAE